MNNGQSNNGRHSGRRQKVKSITLLTPHTGKNLGDAAIQEAVIQNIRRRLPSALIRGIVLEPENVAKLHGIRCFPLTSSLIGKYGQRSNDGNGTKARRWSNNVHNTFIGFLLKALLFFPQRGLRLLNRLRDEIRHILQGHAFLKGTDVLVASGGGQIDDHWGGAWHHPYTLFKWSMLARISGAKLIFMSVGADHLDSSLTKFFIKRTLSLADYRSYRDDETRIRMQKIGINGGDRVYPDLAYSLCQVINLDDHVLDRGNKLVIGVSPIGASSLAKKNDAAYEKYLMSLTSLASWLLCQKHAILFFASQTSSDPPVIEEIRCRLEASGITYDSDQIISEPAHDVGVLLDQISKTDVVVASRFHSVLLSHFLAKPVLALSYGKKVKNLMTAVGLVQYCLDINHLEFDEMKNSLAELISKRNAVSVQMSERAKAYRDSLDEQYDVIFGRPEHPVVKKVELAGV